MSSSNEVGIYALEELTAYGVLESSGNFLTARKTGESLDGTPQTKISAEMRKDRQSSGQKVVGLQVGGGLNQEMVRDVLNDQFMGGAMYNTPVAAASSTADVITIDATGKTLTFAVADPSSTVSVGDFVTLSGFSAINNNTTVLCTAVDATTITYVGGELLTDEIGGGDEIATVPSHLEIGLVKRSWSIEREYGDLTSKFIDYLGMRVAKLDMTLAYGDFATVVYTFAGNGYDPMPLTEMSNGRTINAVSTNTTLNATSDTGMVLVDGQAAECGFSKLSVTVDNGMQASTKIGTVAPCNQTGFSAKVNLSATMELTDSNTDLVKNKLDQTPIELATFSVDTNGVGYGIHVYAAQLSFSDPSASGENQFVSMDMSGVAKVDSVYGRTMRIYLMGTI